MIIAIDFDGTCVTHEFPKIGKEIGAVPVLKKLIESGHKLILNTMRSDIESITSNDINIHRVAGNFLTDAENWFKKHEIELFGVNNNPEQLTWTHSPKVYAQIYIDDCALGCPLKVDKNISANPFVDWNYIDKILEEKNLF